MSNNRISGVVISLRLICLLLVVFVVCNGSVQGQEKKKTVISQQKIAPLQSKKAVSFLEVVKKAKTIEEVQKAFRQAKFSQAELKWLEAEAKKEPYAGKLRNLSAKAKSAIEKKKAEFQAKALQERKVSLAKQKNKLVSLNNATTKSFQQAKARLAPTAEMELEDEDPPEARWDRVARATDTRPSGAGDTGARITSVSDVVVGENVTIEGERFQVSAGRVVVVLGRNLYDTELVSWSASTIVVTIPESLATLVWEAPRDCRVWVKLRGMEVGPYVETTISPNPDLITPVISSINSTQFSPGQLLFIYGDHFFNRRGEISFRFRDGTIRMGEIVEWMNTIILTKLPDSVQGLRRQDCDLVVKNRANREASRTLSFRPLLDVIVMHQSHATDYCYFFGVVHRAWDFNFELINDWEVTDSSLTSYYNGIYGNAVFDERPAVGSTSPLAVVRYWAEAFTVTYAFASVTISGPKGVIYRR